MYVVHISSSTYAVFPPRQNIILFMMSTYLNWHFTLHSSFYVCLISRKSNRVVHPISGMLWETLQCIAYVYTAPIISFFVKRSYNCVKRFLNCQCLALVGVGYCKIIFHIIQFRQISCSKIEATSKFSSTSYNNIIASQFFYITPLKFNT